MSAGGIDPNTANGLTMAMHLVDAPVSLPEPATGGLAAAALIAGLILVRRK